MRSNQPLTALIVLFAIAQPTNAQDPWSEKAVPGHLSQTTLSGSLSDDQLKALIDHGETLFTAKFTDPDGVGRPMATQAIIPTRRKRPAPQLFQRLPGSDANACSSCHTDPVTGGAGDLVANVFVSEGFTNADFDTTDPQFSNERNTNHLMGAGLVELLAREMSADLQRQRAEALAKARSTGEMQTAVLETKGVSFGTITAHSDGMVDLSNLDGVDTDLVIRPFSQKGVIASLRQFTVNALNHHHGMQASERFGSRWTGTEDFDEDGVSNEISEGDVSALVAWQATRPAPVRLDPQNAQWRDLAARGSNVFDAIGCAQCHKRVLPLNNLVFADPGSFDAAGTLRPGDLEQPVTYDLSLLPWVAALQRDENGAVLVPLFGDLKRHKIADRAVNTLGNELLGQRFVDRDVFMTSELWGIASTAPYGHRGDLTTLDAVVQAHGGAGRASRDAYIESSDDDRTALIAFLKTLVIADD